VTAFGWRHRAVPSPFAAYLDYALQHTDKRICLVSALGSMRQGQMRSVRKGDVMIAISFSPYAEETIGVAKAATERGAKLVAISDSRMSPLAKLAHVTLVVQDRLHPGFSVPQQHHGAGPKPVHCTGLHVGAALQADHLKRSLPGPVGRPESKFKYNPL